MIKKITSFFPLWAILFSVIALFIPHYFQPFKDLIIPFLIVIMFSMGLTLTVDDFVRVIKDPKKIFLGVALQYLVMPLLAFFISKMFGLSDELLVGMVLVGSVSGGTASNVICYLAKADVALSVSMTTVSTLFAFIVTPFLTSFYAGQYVPVPVVSMLASILKIVLVPLILGVILNKFFHERTQKLDPILPLISMFAIVFIIGVIVALNHEKISSMGFAILIAVVLHNLSGLTLGYFSGKVFNYDEKTCRTIAIEVGMQNSGLAVALASKYFSSLSALPGAIFSIWHNLSGSLLASIWVRKNKIES